MIEHKDNKEFLNKHGIKNTKQRNIIFDILSKSQTLITAEDIYLEIINIDNSISLSTVYRILDIFVDKKIALKSNLPGKDSFVFELNHFEHKHHLICLKCKKVIHLKNCPLTEFEQYVENETNFSVTGHNLELYGYCPECKESCIKKP